MRADVAIIGGTGLGSRLMALKGAPFFVPTPSGMLRGRLLELNGVNVYCVVRHSAGHRLPPHKVEYRAMAHGLRRLGVRACLASAAVGSMRPEWLPGTMALCSDFLDLSSRNITLYDDTVVHRDFSEPFAPIARTAILDEADALGQFIEPEAVYVNANGPRYETPQEIRTFRQLGGDIVGMTAASEATVMREAEVPYACVAVVTNLAAGMSAGHLDHSEVVDVMGTAGPRLLELLIGAAKRIATS